MTLIIDALMWLVIFILIAILISKMIGTYKNKD